MQAVQKRLNRTEWQTFCATPYPTNLFSGLYLDCQTFLLYKFKKLQNLTDVIKEINTIKEKKHV